MSASPARAAALSALTLIDTTRTDLGGALARTRDRLADSRDRALATELITGTLRWRAALDYQLAQRSGRRLATLDPLVLDSLRLGAYQLLHLQRVPVSAIVNDSVTLVKTSAFKSASGFVNAVLRRLAREREALVWPERPEHADSAANHAALITHLATVHSHPEWIVDRWVTRYGIAAAEHWLIFNNQPPPITLAINASRFTRAETAARLAAEGITTHSTRHAANGLVVVEGRALASSAFREGACLIQDEASQLIAALVLARSGERVFDACAAPGGKTVALAAQVGDTGFVVASDVRARRMRLLHATLARCRPPRTALVQIGARNPLPFADATFDRVLIDAPCSGVGTVRRDPDIRWRRQPGDLPALAAAQLDLLMRVGPLVRASSTLIYSTCSSEPEENEQVIADFLAAAPQFELRPLSQLDVPDTLRRFATPEGFFRTLPHRDALEAFFGAVLQRQP